ncbi:MAG: ABC transporter permease [Streptomycetales bacterium]
MTATTAPETRTPEGVPPAAGGDRGPGGLAARIRVLLGSLLRVQSLVVVAAVILIGYLAVVPLFYLVWGTFFDATGFTLGAFERAYGQRGMGTMVANSLVFASGAALVSLVVGTALAYLNVRTDVPFRAVFFAASMVPLIIPGILYTVAWIFLASPEIGLVNIALRPLFGGDVFDVFSIPGMIWVEGLHLSPLVFLLMVAAFRSMDPSLEESALMSGAGRWTVFRRITLPLVRPAVLAAVLIMVVRSLESFEVPALLGLQNGIYVYTSRIYLVLRSYPPDLAAAGALATSLLLLAVAGIAFANLAGRGGKTFQTITGKGFRPRPMELGRMRPLVGVGIIAYFCVTVILPLLMMLWVSVLDFYRAPSPEALESLTWDNYRAVFGDTQASTALKNSLILGVSAATGVMAVMAVGAWLVVRSRVPGRSVVDHLSFLPLVVPGLVLGLALSFVYLRSPIPIYGTLFILLIAYCTRFMPYGMRYAVTSMHQISGELEESAHVSGASWWSTFRRVIVPLMAPGLLAGWVYIFVVSFRELSSSILLYSPGNEVLAILIWEQYENGDFTILAAVGVVMVVTLIAVVTVAYKLGARVGLRQD